MEHRLERLVVFASDYRWSEVLDAIKDLKNVDCSDLSELMIRLAYFGTSSWIRPLIALGADPRYRDETGDTALGSCLAGSNYRHPTIGTVRSLLEAGADPNEITRGGNRILQLAIAENRPEIATILLLHGADPSLPSPDPDRPNAFDSAASFGISRSWALPLLERWDREARNSSIPK